MKKLSNRRWNLILLLAVLLFTTSACIGEQANLSPVPTDTPHDVSSTSLPLTGQMLENLEYHGIYDHPVILAA
jgi:hypothetical protein